MFCLRVTTDPAWAREAVKDLDAVLVDHAHCEMKAATNALSLVVRHPGDLRLVQALTALAREELEHFARVYRLLAARGRPLAQDAPDPYTGALRKLMRKRDVEEYLLDRLLVFAVVEARACERFGLLGEALPDSRLQRFYAELTRAEARHHAQFQRLAQLFAPAEVVATRLEEILAAEAAVVRQLTIRPALH
jgi:tRNA-(ms[2]io[6]A)-hydroxylase